MAKGDTQTDLLNQEPTAEPTAGAIMVDKSVLETMLAEIQELKAFKQEQTELVKSSAVMVSEISEPNQANEYMDELVTILLFKDKDKYKDDVVVAVNGNICRVKRGVPVEIKRKFALALEQSHRQEMMAAEMDEAEVGKFEDRVRAALEG
jgi:hypothetical protein